MRLLRHMIIASLMLGCGVQTGWAQETRLIFTSLSPAGSPNSVFFNSWAQRVNAQSGGTLKIEVRDGTTLANFGNSYDRVLADVVQIGWVQPAFIAGKFPLAEITNLPFMTDDDVNCSVSLSRYYKSPVMAAELKDVVPIWTSCLRSNRAAFRQAAQVRYGSERPQAPRRGQGAEPDRRQDGRHARIDDCRKHL